MVSYSCFSQIFFRIDLIYYWPCILFYFSIPRFLKIPGKFKVVINANTVVIHINTHIHIYDRCIYVQYLIYVLVTCPLLTSVTLSQLAIKLVYLDTLCSSSDYKEVSVLFYYPTERVAKTDNCHIFDQFLSISSKMHNLVGLFNLY